MVERDIKLGRDRLFDVWRAARLLVVPHRTYHKTTRRHHRFRRYLNRLNAGPEQVVPIGQEQIWIADVTYLPPAHRFAQLQRMRTGVA